MHFLEWIVTSAKRRNYFLMNTALDLKRQTQTSTFYEKFDSSQPPSFGLSWWLDGEENLNFLQSWTSEVLSSTSNEWKEYRWMNSLNALRGKLRRRRNPFELSIKALSFTQRDGTNSLVEKFDEILKNRKKVVSRRIPQRKVSQSDINSTTSVIMIDNAPFSRATTIMTWNMRLHKRSPFPTRSMNSFRDFFSASAPAEKENSFPLLLSSPR